MLILNFAHPLTPPQLARVAELAGRPVERVLDIKTHFDGDRPFADQGRELLDAVPLRHDEWQTAPLVFNLPSFVPVAAVLLADLHGRAGYFPTAIRLRPVFGAVPPVFEVAELVPLQAVRDDARSRR